MWFRQNPVKQYFENSNETEIVKFIIQFIDPNYSRIPSTIN
jgi:hypothetical protein